MQVSVRGWSRDHGTTLLFNREVRNVDVERKIKEYSRERPVIELEKDSETQKVQYIIISNLLSANLNGEYLFQVKLSATDAIYLCWLAVKSRGFGAVSKLFASLDRR